MTEPNNDAPAEDAPVQDSAEAPAPKNSRGRVLGAAGWVTIGQAASRVLSLGSSLVLTRLLMPEVYGIMEIVYIFHSGLHMFSDLGIDQSIVHSRRGDDVTFLNTAWTMQVVRGLLLFVAAAALGVPVSLAYGQPELALLIPAVAMTAVFDGLLSISVKRYARHLWLGPVVGLEFFMQATVVIVQVMVALVWPSPWALVIGAWLGTSGKALASHLLLERHPHRFTWEPAAVKELFTFGSWIFASSALNFVNLNGDRLLLGTLISMADLGVYAIATRLRDAVNMFRGQIIRYVMYPLIAERNRELDPDSPNAADELSSLYYRGRLRTDALFVTAGGILWTFGGSLVLILYPDSFAAAGPALMILALQLSMMSTVGAAESVLTAVGDTKQFFLQTLGRSVAIGIGIPLGYHFAGFWGVVWATALSEIPAGFVVIYRKHSRGLLRPWLEARAILFFIAGAAIGLLLHTAVVALGVT